MLSLIILLLLGEGTEIGVHVHVVDVVACCIVLGDDVGVGGRVRRVVGLLIVLAVIMLVVVGCMLMLLMWFDLLCC